MSVVTETCHGPLHIHVSEQPAENEAAIERYGRTPTRVLADTGALGPSTTIVHGVHTNDADRSLLVQSGSSVCVCPTTEADLGDGIAPVAEFTSARIDVSLGSDSHAVIDLFAEMQAVERQDRARLGRRSVHEPSALLTMASTNGARSLGHDRWGLVPGGPGDFVVVDHDSLRTAGTEDAVGLVLTASASDVRHVIRGGEHIVDHGEHRAVADVPRLLDDSIQHLWEAVWST
jgi:cytosine/adenosine deaminase-related metal-dependent hydrolase